MSNEHIYYIMNNDVQCHSETFSIQEQMSFIAAKPHIDKISILFTPIQGIIAFLPSTQRHSERAKFIELFLSYVIHLWKLIFVGFLIWTSITWMIIITYILTLLHNSEGFHFTQNQESKTQIVAYEWNTLNWRSPGNATEKTSQWKPFRKLLIARFT